MKNAKKSMFITTILMVAVLIVAVSTATFAWYTSSGVVNASSTELSTATANDANIAIGWAQNAKSTKVDFKPATNLVPMVPKIAFVETTTAAAAVASMNTGILQANESGTATFKDGTVAPATPWTQVESKEDGSAGETTLYLINYNTTKEATVTITMEAQNVAEKPAVVDYFHLAVFAQEDGDSGIVYKGLLGASNANYGTVEVGQSGLKEGGTIAKEAVTITIPAATGENGGVVALALVGWIDGVELNNSLAGGAVTFTLSITAQ